MLEEVRRPGERHVHPHDAVEALAQAGLLADDLPIPAGEYERPESEGQYHGWNARGAYVELSSTQEIRLINMRESLTLEEAVSVARAMFAAAQYAKEQAWTTDGQPFVNKKAATELTNGN